MNMFVAVFGLLCLVGASSAVQKNWALLIAGSNTYLNYRHQADICHAYQILHKNGIPDEQIVVMMYDDIAHSSENPFPGNVINQPNGPNVYPGVIKDYTGPYITAETFLAALQGDEEEVKRLTGSKNKVIKSGPEDHVFVYYADHGAPGILGMPQDQYPLQGSDIIKAIKAMHRKKQFAKMTWYVEACESGSIFSGVLPDNLNVFATTAANTTESSYACYFDKKRDTYLGDVYSVNWMQDTDKHNPNTETLETQFLRVKKLTNTSHVMQYGNLSLDYEFLSDFMSPAKHNSYRPRIKFGPAPPITDAVPSEMVPVMILKNKILNANPEQRTLLEHELAQLERRNTEIYQLFEFITRLANTGISYNQVVEKYMTHHEDIENRDCYESAVKTLTKFCPALRLGSDESALRKLYMLVNLCNRKPESLVLDVIRKVSDSARLCY